MNWCERLDEIFSQAPQTIEESGMQAIELSSLCRELGEELDKKDAQIELQRKEIAARGLDIVQGDDQIHRLRQYGDGASCICWVWVSRKI